MHRSRYLRSKTSSGYIATRLHRHSDTSPLSWNAIKAPAPGAQQLTLTSSYTLHRSRYLRSQTSSGYIATRLERHQGHSARSPAAHFDEFVYSGQVTLPEESDQLRLYCHSALAPGATQLTLTSSSTLDRSRCLRSQISSGYIATRLYRHSASAPGATLLTLTSSSTLDRSRYLRSQISSGYIATRPQRPEPRCSP